MVDQIQSEGTYYLHKFADYMKKSAVVALIMAIGCSVILIVGIFVDIYAPFLLIRFILIVAGIGLLIFQIMQQSFLSRAKNTASDPLLTQCSILRLSALIALGVGILSFFTFFLPILLAVLNLILTIFGYNALINFAEKHYSPP